MNDRSGIVPFRMGVWKLLGIRRGAGKEGAPYVKKETEIQLTLNMQRNSKTEETFFEQLKFAHK
jgi:hypothetical protein